MENFITKEVLKKLVFSADFLGVKEVSHLERIDALETLLKFSRAQFRNTTGSMYTVVLGNVITVYQGNDLWSYTLDGAMVKGGDAALENLLKLGY